MRYILIFIYSSLKALSKSTFLKLLYGPFMRKSFDEVDGKVRRCIYIYLWFTACCPLIAILIDIFIISGFSYSMVVPVVLNLIYIIIVLFLRYIPSLLFACTIQVVPLVDIKDGIFSAFRLIYGASTLFEEYSTILVAIAALWALRYILRLRRHAKNKVS